MISSFNPDLRRNVENRGTGEKLGILAFKKTLVLCGLRSGFSCWVEKEMLNKERATLLSFHAFAFKNESLLNLEFFIPGVRAQELENLTSSRKKRHDQLMLYREADTRYIKHIKSEPATNKTKPPS